MRRGTLQNILHLAFLFTRPMTIGVRGLCFDRRTNSVLLVKHTYSKGWALPGGGVEFAESSLTALERELSEEVGIACNSAVLLDLYHNSSISKRDHVAIYLVESWQEQPESKRPKLEIAEAAWFNLNRLPDRLTPCTFRGLELCILSRPSNLIGTSNT